MWVFIGLQLAYIVLMLAAGFVFSYLTRKVATRVLFKEAQWINYTVSIAVSHYTCTCTPACT